MNLFLIPASNKNAEKTLINPVPIETAAKFLSPSELRRLTEAIAPSKSFRCWAMTEASRHVFDAMQIGDFAVFSLKGTGKFNYKARVCFKLENDKLGSELWEYTPSTPWKLIYFLENVEAITIDKSRLVTSLGYEHNDRVSGSRLVKPEFLSIVINKYGSVEAFLAILEDTDWTADEVKAVVADYFDMLIKELRGEKYSKTEHRNRLIPKLNNRSKASVEYKHRNVSAVLVGDGLPYIDGYKPARNYQRMLGDTVDVYIQGHPDFLLLLEKTSKVTPSPVNTSEVRYSDGIVEPPERTEITKSKNRARSYKGRKVDYAKLESENRTLGKRGEEYVVAIERDRLTRAGRPDLAKRVDHVSLKLDGLGHDVASFEVDGSERCIEVKTTKHGKDFPFLISENELQFSIDHCSKCYLYRVFNFGKSPKFFMVKGSLRRLQPTHIY